MSAAPSAVFTFTPTPPGEAPAGELDESLLMPVPGQTAWWHEPEEQRAARMTALLPFAANPSLSPAVLRRIAETAGALWHYQLDYTTPEQKVLNALAANPNTPPEVLARCAGMCPEAFCRNPVAPLLPLESPEWAQGIPAYGLGQLLRHRDVPVPVLAAISSAYPDGPGGQAARLHVALAGEAAPGEDWQEQAREVWRGCLDDRSLSTRAKRLRLYEMMALGLTEALPADVFESADFVAYRDALEAACDPETTEEKLKTLTAGNGWAVRLALVLNPGTPEKLRNRHTWRLRKREIARDGMDRFLASKSLTTREEVKSACRAIVRQALRCATCDSPLISYTAMARFGEPLPEGAKEPPVTRRQRTAAESDDFRQRLGAALTLPASRRAGRALLAVLADDGNRLVRAAARARLADGEKRSRPDGRD